MHRAAHGLAAVGPDLALNTAVSFATNTNWQAYAGESTMSHLSQMAALAWHNFTSAAVGIGIAFVLAVINRRAYADLVQGTTIDIAIRNTGYSQPPPALV